MKKIFLILLLLPFMLVSQEISIYGNRGMFKLQYAQPHNIGMLSFHISPSERFESLDPIIINGEEVVDRKHFVDVSAGFSYAIVDFLEARFRVTTFMKWFEMSNFPVSRGDPSPVIGFKTVEIGAKAGYPFIINRMTPLLYAVGVDLYVDFGPRLSTQYFNNALVQDERFYADSFAEGGAPYVTPNFPPHIPHDPDYGFSGLFDFRAGPFAAHLNVGYLMTGEDERPTYVALADFIERPNYLTHGLGIELIASENARLLFEAMGYYDMDASSESLWVTPGLRFGARTLSFDLGCEFGIRGEPFWKAFFNFSVGIDLVKEIEVHIPIARISGRVYDVKTGEPVAAKVSIPGSDKDAIQTGEDGFYEVSLSPGSYRFRVDAPEYRWKEAVVVLKDGESQVLDFGLNVKPIANVVGKIYDAQTKDPIVAQITFPQTEYEAITSDTAGMYRAALIPGTFRIRVEATDYQFDEKIVTLSEGETKMVDIALNKIGVAQATLTGKVSEVESGVPILAQISFVNTNIPAVTTDPITGIYKVTIPPGTYSVKVEAEDYVIESAPVILAKDEAKIQNFALRKIPAVGEKIVLKGITFGFNSAVIRPESYPVLDDAAKVIKSKPTMRVEIGGHTDSIGSDSYNQKLSYQRANAVRDYLIKYHTVDPSRIVAVGYGERQPIADNRTKSGRELNRRIEFKVLSLE
ncbi:MAG: OmpA family protein [candidate division WOR-3 bacterium]|nr:MAG: OmpA family protein [candidate division WOR-3 bacterium]